MMCGETECPKVRCELRLEFESEASAEKVHRSVELDNEGYVATRVDGRVIHAVVEADSLKSLLHTLDDFLACTGVADKMVSNKD
jgi:tRNA threonylcarbamoyladenosine modification (KEOPS) complex  Pcc1 subunit